MTLTAQLWFNGKKFSLFTLKRNSVNLVMLTRKNNIRFLIFLFCSTLLLFTFCQYKPSYKAPEPKRSNYYGVRDKTVEINLEEGEKKFCVTYEGDEMDLDLINSEGKRCELTINDWFEAYPGEKITRIKDSGKYFLDVKAPGFWHVVVIDN